MALTLRVADATLWAYGGMAEWSIAAVLKTAVRKDRGFESSSLRHALSSELKALTTTRSVVVSAFV